MPQTLSIAKVEDLRIASMEDATPAATSPSTSPDDDNDKSFWKRAWEAAKAVPDVARLLVEQPAATMAGAAEGVKEGVRTVAPTVARVGGAVAGGLAGAPLGPAGIAAGGALGAAGGEALAETIEGRELNPYQIGLQGALGAIPGGGSVLAQAGKGALLGGVGATGTALADNRLPSVEEVALGTIGGGVLGGAATRRPRTATPALEAPQIAAIDDITPGPGAPRIERVPELGEHATTVAYDGPDRRIAAGAPPDGVERRASVDQPIDTTDPVRAVTQMMEENPRVVKDAAELGERARASRMPAPPREVVEPEVPRGTVPETAQSSTLPPVQEPAAPAHVEPPAAPEPAALQPASGKPALPSTRRSEQTAAALGRPIPEQLPLSRERIEGESTMISKMPEPVRTSVAEIIERNNHFEAQRRGVQPNARTQALADYITVEARKVLPKGTALNAEETVAYARAAATVQDRISDLAAKVEAGTASDVDLVRLAQSRAEQIAVTASFLGARAETGRALNAHKQLIDLFETQDVIAIQQALKNPKFREDLQGFAKQWAALPDDQAKLDFLRKHAQNTWTDTLRSVYFSNILSGAKTHLRNIIGNTANMVFSTAANTAAVGYDIGRSAVTGQARTIYGREVPHRAFGAVAGLQQGLKDALFTLQHGYAPKALATFDVPRPELAGGGKNPFNWTGRALEAEDQFFYGVAYHQELYARLYAKARAEASKRGLTGQAQRDHIVNAVAEGKLHPPDDVAEAAEKAALRMVYKEDPGRIAQWLTHGKEVAPVLDFVIPFVKTPANIIRQGVEATPLAPLTKQARDAFAAGGRESAEAVGRMTVGTVALTTLAFWAAQGKISGDGPKDPEERAALMERGWRPNSVRIGDRWVDYTNLAGSLAQPLFAIGNAFEQYRREGTPPNPVEVAASTGGAILSQSFLSGLSDLNNALSDPGRYGERFGARVAQGFVPFSGMARNVAQAIDPVVRDPRGGITENLKTIVPGVSTSVDPKIDRFGEPVTRPGGPFTRGMSPVGISRETQDPVLQELSRLKIDTIGVPPRTLPATKRDPKIELTIEERQRIGRATKQAIQQVLAHPNWANVDEDVARDSIARAVQRARFTATQSIRQARRGGR